MSQILKLNRSLANIKLQHYDEALEDAGKLTANAQQSEKGFYRAALSLYELGRFQESHQALAPLISHYPHCHAEKKEIIRTKQRLREQEHGDYDFRAMYKAAEDAHEGRDCWGATPLRESLFLLLLKAFEDEPSYEYSYKSSHPRYAGRAYHSYSAEDVPESVTHAGIYLFVPRRLQAS